MDNYQIKLTVIKFVHINKHARQDQASGHAPTGRPANPQVPRDSKEFVCLRETSVGDPHACESEEAGESPRSQVRQLRRPGDIEAEAAAGRLQEAKVGQK